MSLIDTLLSVSVVSTGLFTGLLMTILAFFQRALKDLSGPQFALVMQRFLRIVRAHPLNYALVFTSAFVPIAALALLRDSPGGAAFVLSALGLLAFWGGPILTSRFFAEPIYDVFMSWEIDAPPKDWPKARERYFRINAIRGLGSVIAFSCFVAALGLPTS